MIVPDRLLPYLAVDSPAYALARRLEAAGHECFLVGGTVRDALLDRPISDLDLTTSARPDVIAATVKGWADSVWLPGQRFGTVSCEKNGARMEITTYRGDIYRPESRKPEVTFADTIEEDLVRRDFTVNAMALAILAPRLVDPCDGVDDLVNRRLRTPRSPEESFADDPLRMLRAARFVASLGFEPDADMVAAMRAMHHRLEIVSAERVRDELERLLVVEDPSLGLWLLCETGLSDEFLPELNAMRLEQDPIHHHKDVLAHTIAVVNNVKSRDRLVRLAALFHDVGKPKTRSFDDGGVSFHHHEVVGARMTQARMRALKFSNDDVDDVTKLVYLHLRIHTYAMGWTDKAVRRYARDAGELLDRLNELQRADCTTRNERKAAALAQRMDELEARISELREREELDAIRPALDGDQVMKFLGLAPGPEVGAALDFLLEVRLDDGPISEAEAYERLKVWAQARDS